MTVYGIDYRFVQNSFLWLRVKHILDKWEREYNEKENDRQIKSTSFRSGKKAKGL